MSTAIWCPCECVIQNVEHVMSECEYMVVYLDEMIDTVDYALQSDGARSCTKEVAEGTECGGGGGSYRRHGSEGSIT